MKKFIKIISVLIVAIIISVTVYVKTSSNNDTVKMQNKEALAEKPLDRYVVDCHPNNDLVCTFSDSWGFSHSVSRAAKDCEK